MFFSDAIAAFLNHRRLKNLSLATLALYKRNLATWQRWRETNQHPADVQAISIDELRAFQAYLTYDYLPSKHAINRRGLSPATVDSYWRLIRAFWRWCDADELLTPAQARFFARGRIPRPRIPETARPSVERDQVNKLLAACDRDDHEADLRNRVIILLLYETGLRVGELCQLCDNDIDLVRQCARVIGKGGRFRWVFWTELTAVALRAYLDIRRGRPGGPLLRGTGSKNNGGQMTPDGMRGIMQRIAADAGITLPRGAPLHSFRHGFVHAALDAGLDLSEVAQLAGHANVATTMIYARRNRGRLQRAHRRIWRRY